MGHNEKLSQPVHNPLIHRQTKMYHGRATPWILRSLLQEREQWRRAVTASPDVIGDGRHFPSRHGGRPERGRPRLWIIMNPEARRSRLSAHLANCKAK